MTTSTFTPAERWPFQAGEAVYYLPNDHSRVRPMPLIPAIVLACHQMRGSPRASATIRRDDKERPSSVNANGLVYRGYCEACEVPAIVGASGVLICPRCLENAAPLPPPDRLVVRWFPLGCWLHPMMARRQVEHPTWTWSAVRDVATMPHEEAYEDMLLRMGLPRLYNSVNFERPIEERQYDSRLLSIMDAAAILRDDALFLSTHQELRARQADVARSRYLAQRLLSLSPDRLEMLLDLASGDAPPAVSFIPLPARPEGDDTPDGADETTRWVEEQFRKKRAA